MIDKAGLIHRRAHFHCGWAILVPPTFQREYVSDGESLSLYDDGHEVTISSMLVKGPDGEPREPDAVLSRWPPEFLAGIRLLHEGKNVRGRAVLVHKLQDDNSEAWVLMGVHAALEASQFLRVTIAVDRAADQSWAVDTWRSVVHTGDDHSRLASLMEDPPVLIKTKRVTSPS
jgi:hypothetical protein